MKATDIKFGERYNVRVSGRRILAIKVVSEMSGEGKVKWWRCRPVDSDGTLDQGSFRRTANQFISDYPGV